MIIIRLCQFGEWHSYTFSSIWPHSQLSIAQIRAAVTLAAEVFAYIWKQMLRATQNKCVQRAIRSVCMAQILCPKTKRKKNSLILFLLSLSPSLHCDKKISSLNIDTKAAAKQALTCRYLHAFVGRFSLGDIKLHCEQQYEHIFWTRWKSHKWHIHREFSIPNLALHTHLHFYSRKLHAINKRLCFDSLFHRHFEVNSQPKSHVNDHNRIMCVAIISF